MSEYWVSHKKYFCRYCEIYIADDVPSRQQHENGLRHKGNTERFIRGLYKAGEKRKKDLEEEKREMARVEKVSMLSRQFLAIFSHQPAKAAQAAFAQDVGAGFAKSITPSLPATSSVSAPPPRKPPTKPSNPYANYSTAESLGYKNPDEERLLAEAERRRTQGVAGDWEMVPSVLPPTMQAPVPSSSTDIVNTGPSLKREADAVVDEEDSRQFKVRNKKLGVGLGEIYDPGIIPIKLKKKKEEESAESSGDIAPSVGESQPTAALKWTKVQWKRAGEEIKQGIDRNNGENSTADEADTTTAASSEGANVKTEELPSPPDLESEQENKGVIRVKGEGISPAPQALEGGSNLFRKRKTPAGTARGKRHV